MLLIVDLCVVFCGNKNLNGHHPGFRRFGETAPFAAAGCPMTPLYTDFLVTQRMTCDVVLEFPMNAIFDPNAGHGAPRSRSKPAPAGTETELTIDFVVVPGFSMLALSAAIEPLRRANSLAGRRVFRWRLLSWSGAPVRCADGTLISVHASMDTGASSELSLVCASENPEQNIPAGLPGRLRMLWRRGAAVGGICSGAFALAAAGILSGHRFTLHWEHHIVFTVRWPDLAPSSDGFCMDRRIFTCAGGFAAADLMLHMVDDLCGPTIARRAMDLCIIRSMLTGQNCQNSSTATKLGTRNSKLVDAVDWIERNFQNPNALAELYQTINISNRQLQRLFKSHIGTTPLGYLNRLRLQHATSLLSETNMSVFEVSVACGYPSPSHFSRNFRRCFGVAPSKYTRFPGGQSWMASDGVA